MMIKTILSATALAMSMGLAVAPLQASAKDRFPTAAEFDTDKDGMVSRDEYIAMAGKKYDEAMAKMMKMPAGEMAKMVKDSKMTMAGFNHFLAQHGGQ